MSFKVIYQLANAVSPHCRLMMPARKTGHKHPINMSGILKTTT